MGTYKLTPQQVDRIWAAYQEKTELRQLAKRFSCSPGTITKALQRAGYLPESLKTHTTYVLKDPNGVVHTIPPGKFTAFCEKHNLTTSGVRGVWLEERSQVRGWTKVPFPAKFENLPAKPARHPWFHHAPSPCDRIGLKVIQVDPASLSSDNIRRMNENALHS